MDTFLLNSYWRAIREPFEKITLQTEPKLVLLYCDFPVQENNN